MKYVEVIQIYYLKRNNEIMEKHREKWYVSRKNVLLTFANFKLRYTRER